MNKSCRNVLEHLEFKNSIANVLRLGNEDELFIKLAKEDEEFVFVSKTWDLANVLEHLMTHAGFSKSFKNSY